MLPTVIFILCSIILLPLIYLEIKLRRERKVLNEIHKLAMLQDVDGLDSLLKSKQAKYLTEYDKFAYSEYSRIAREFKKIRKQYEETN